MQHILFKILYKKDVPTSFTTAMQLAGNRYVYDACLKLDDALSSNASADVIDSLQKNLIETARAVSLGYDFTDSLSDEDIIKYLGINTSKGEDFKYVANPLLSQ